MKFVTQYRVKVNTLADGTTLCYPQYTEEVWFRRQRWVHFEDLAHDTPYTVKFTTVDEALTYIEAQKAKALASLSAFEGGKLVRTEYVTA